MKTCPVCRLDLSALTAVCPDCETILGEGPAEPTALSEIPEESEAQPPAAVELGNVLLDRFSVLSEIASGRYQVEHSETQRKAVAAVFLKGRGTNPLTLSEHREQLLKRPHPSLERLLDARVDGQGRGVVISAAVPGQSLEALIADPERARQLIPRGSLTKMALDLAEALELVHRKWPHGALTASRIRIAPNGRPVIVDLLGSILGRSVDGGDQADERERLAESRSLAQHLAKLTRVLLGDQRQGPEGRLLELLENFSEETDEAAGIGTLLARLGELSRAGGVPRLSSAVPLKVSSVCPKAPAAAMIAARSDSARFRPPEGEGRANVGLGLGAAMTPRERAVRSDYVPVELIAERQRKVQEAAERREAMLAGREIGPSLRGQLAADLLLLNGAVWIGMALSSQHGSPRVAAGTLIAVLLLGVVAWRLRVQASAGQVFLWILPANLLCAMLIAPTGGSFLAAMLLTGLSVKLADFSTQGSIGWSKVYAPGIANSRTELRRIELANTVDRMRAYGCGGIALALAWLPGALHRDFVGILLLRAVLIGALVVFLGLRSAHAQGAELERRLKINFLIGALGCATAHLTEPLVLILGLLASGFSAWGFIALLLDGSLGQEAAAAPAGNAELGPRSWTG